MLDYLLEVQAKPILLIFKNLDNYLKHDSFVRIVHFLEMLCDKYPYFHVLLFPSQEGYLYLTESTIETVNIYSDQIEHYPDFSFLYHSYMNSYPSTHPLDTKEFLDSLRKISPYLFSNDVKKVVSLSDVDLITLKIINSLYNYDVKMEYANKSISKLEENYLIS